jgi:hypothetical protein
MVSYSGVHTITTTSYHSCLIVRMLTNTTICVKLKQSHDRISQQIGQSCGQRVDSSSNICVPCGARDNTLIVEVALIYNSLCNVLIISGTLCCCYLTDTINSLSTCFSSNSTSLDLLFECFPELHYKMSRSIHDTI